MRDTWWLSPLSLLLGGCNFLMVSCIKHTSKLLMTNQPLCPSLSLKFPLPSLPSFSASFTSPFQAERQFLLVYVFASSLTTISIPTSTLLGGSHLSNESMQGPLFSSLTVSYFVAVRWNWDNTSSMTIKNCSFVILFFHWLQIPS